MPIYHCHIFQIILILIILIIHCSAHIRLISICVLYFHLPIEYVYSPLNTGVYSGDPSAIIDDVTKFRDNELGSSESKTHLKSHAELDVDH